MCLAVHCLSALLEGKLPEGRDSACIPTGPSTEQVLAQYIFVE